MGKSRCSAPGTGAGSRTGRPGRCRAWPPPGPPDRPPAQDATPTRTTAPCPHPPDTVRRRARHSFEVLDSSAARVVGRYPADADKVLLSGWVLHPERVAGRAALVEAKLGTGRVVLFGFRPQYRGQSIATYPLLFNSLRLTAR